jgi:hypothetical protein
MESAMGSELAGLRALVEGEEAGASRREGELRALEQDLRASLAEKRALLASEERVLLQMDEVRALVQEQVVRTQLDAAIAKKQQLVQIEREVVADIQGLCVQIEGEVGDILDKLDSLSAVRASLSSSSSWVDIEALQVKVAGSIQVPLMLEPFNLFLNLFFSSQEFVGAGCEN